VKDVFDVGDGKFAALKFPLPGDADYIFFKPDDQERFVKLTGAFADTYPLLPGGQPSQIMTSYLMPYSEKREFTYKAPVDVAQINFLLPDQAGISLKETGLVGPESTTLQDGTSYEVYSYSNLKAGQMLIGGTTGSSPSTGNTSNLFAVLAAFLGFGVIGFGLWRWRTSANAQTDDASAEPGEQTLDELIAEIARLDEQYEQQDISAEEYQTQRQALMQKAKQLL
jgi:LPXTG-motif cell wall-anchored protein